MMLARRYCLMAWLAVAAALAASCQSPPTTEVAETDKLTREEYVALVETCRGVLLNSSRLTLTPEQREFVRREAPRFNVDYTGHKEGHYTMVWELPGEMALSIAGEGRMLERSCRVRISVVRF